MGVVIWLDNLKLGYGGTKTEMERLLADAQKLTGVKYNINNLSDVYEAIHVIQQELGITGTTAEEAEKTLIGSFNAMKAAAQNLMGEFVLGGELQSIETSMKTLVKATSTFLIDNLIPALGNIIAGLPSAIGTLLAEAVPKIAKEGGHLIEALTMGINEKVPEFAETFPVIVQGWLNKAGDALPSILEKGGELIGSLAQAILENAPKFAEAMAKVWMQMGAWLDENKEVIGEKVGTLIGQIAVYIVENVPQMVLAAGKILDAVIETIRKLPAVLLEIAKKAIGEFIRGLVPDRVKTKMESIKNAVVKPIEKAREAVKKAVEKIKSFFNITLKFKGIKLPHITVSWNKKGALGKIAGKLGLPGVPDFGVSWYKTGGIFDKPSVIGVGEAGKEAVVPLDKFWEKLDRIGDAAEARTSSNVNIEINFNQPVASPIETARAIRRQLETGLAGA